MFSPRRLRSGFSLIELMVALAIGSTLMGWVMLSFTALQRSFEAANYQMTAQNDQLRVLDYVTRDARMASAVTPTNNGGKLVLAIPVDSSTTVSLKLGPLFDPLLGATAATTANVAYYVEGGQFVREVNGAPTVIADTVDSLLFDRQGSYLTTNILFTPRFSSSPTTASQASTRVVNSTFLRNAVPAN